MYRLRWRLHYYDRAPVDESPDGSSIMLAPRGAVSLRTEFGEITKVPRGMKPIWYRVKSLGIDASGPRVEAVVAGYGHVMGNGTVEGTLWLLGQRGELQDVPDEYIDHHMVELQLGG